MSDFQRRDDHDPGEGGKPNSPKPAPPCSTNRRLTTPKRSPRRCETGIRHFEQRTKPEGSSTPIAPVSLASALLAHHGPRSLPFPCAGLRSGPSGPPPAAHQRGPASNLPTRADAILSGHGSHHGRKATFLAPLSPGLPLLSLGALKWKNGSHRPVAVGGTLRRLTTKALLATVSQDMARYLPGTAVKPSSKASDDGSRNTTTTKNGAMAWRTVTCATPKSVLSFCAQKRF